VPRDEYEWYVPRLASLLRQGADQLRVETQLAEWRTGRMGLPPDRRADGIAAAKVMDWYTNPFYDEDVRPSELPD
jgi:hypothetical protein